MSGPGHFRILKSSWLSDRLVDRFSLTRMDQLIQLLWQFPLGAPQLTGVGAKQQTQLHRQRPLPPDLSPLG